MNNLKLTLHLSLLIPKKYHKAIREEANRKGLSIEGYLLTTKNPFIRWI